MNVPPTSTPRIATRRLYAGCGQRSTSRRWLHRERPSSSCRVGAGGEPVDLRRTITSHGVAELPPAGSTRRRGRSRSRLPLARPRPRRCASRRRAASARQVEVRRRSARATVAAPRRRRSRHVLRLDEDLVRVLRRRAPQIPDLAWVGDGRRADDPQPDRLRGGRQDDLHHELRVVGDGAHGRALVEHLGEPGERGRRAPGAHSRRPAAMAERDEDCYRDVVRAGYRGAYLRRCAGRSRRASSTSRSSGARAPTSSPTTRSPRRLLALPASGRTPPRT